MPTSPVNRRHIRLTDLASRAGQTLIESCIVIAAMAFLLFGVLQLSQVLAAREILAHAAARGARAKTVGFNRWMVDKVVDVAAIPNAGRMLVPGYDTANPGLQQVLARDRPGAVWDYALRTQPGSGSAPLETARIPEYLGAENFARARFILDYADWDTIHNWSVETGGGNEDAVSITHVHVFQDYRLWAPMHRAFYDGDSASIAGDASIESHYPLYIEDFGW